jgi:iron complex transport system substrate-binding protein
MTTIHFARRSLKLLAAFTLILPTLLLAACGDDESGPPASGTSTANHAAPAAFPVTIEHKYGSTTIENAPERVVTVGLNEQDAFFALGVAPVGVTDWMGFEHGIGPWAKEAAAAAGPPPELLTNTDGIQFEKIAALRPDVIVALYSDLEKGDYEKLSQIAPTVAPPAGHADFGIPWQQTTETVGKIVGKPEEAAKLVDDLEARIAKERADHPEFQGKTASMAMSYEGIWVYGPDDPRSRLLVDLGFKLSPAISKLFVKDYAGKISDEQVQLLDLDAVAWFAIEDEAAKLARNRVYTSLPVHKEGRDFVVLDSRPDQAYNAVGAQTVLSIPLALDVLVPALSDAVDGDPETVPLKE